MPREADLQLVDAMGYVNFVSLVAHSTLVLTIREHPRKKTYLGTPCLTARLNTERPTTISEGTNQLVPTQADAIAKSCA